MLTIAGVILGLLLFPIAVALLPLVLRLLGFALVGADVVVVVLVAASALRSPGSNVQFVASAAKSVRRGPEERGPLARLAPDDSRALGLAQ